MRTENKFDYECIEPELGDKLWQYDSPVVNQEIKSKLKKHLTLCAKCNQIRELDFALEAGLRSGSLQIQKQNHDIIRLFAPKIAASLGVLAIVASIVLMFVMPFSNDENYRNEKNLGFVAPLSSEVITGGDVEIAWSPLEKATGYKLRLQSEGGDWKWSKTVYDNKVKVNNLPSGSIINAYLKSIPSDLTPSGGWNVTFQHGNLFKFVQFRVNNFSLFPKILALFGLILFGGSFILRWSFSSSELK